MKLIELMFCNPQSETAELLMHLTETLSDLQAWPDLSEPERADLFGKLIGTKQAIDHCLRVNYKTDPDHTPKRLEDVCGAAGLSPWGLPSAMPPMIDGPFVDCVERLLKGGAQ